MYLSFINYRTENAVVGEAHFRWNGQWTTRTVTCLFNEEKRLTFQLADQLAASRDKTVSSLLKKHLVFVFNRRKPEIIPSNTLFLNTSRNFRHVGWYLKSECELHLVSGLLMDVKRKSLFLRNMPKNIIRGLEGQKSNFKAKLEIIGFASRLFENLEVEQPILPEISHILLTWSSRPYLQGDLAPCCEPAGSRTFCCFRFFRGGCWFVYN